MGVTYTAARGGGAWRDGKRLTGSVQTRLDQALVATGFGYTVARRERQARILTRVIGKVRDVRRFGSAALDLSAAAAGIVDAYYEQGLHPWDLAAGGLIAQEAGLTVAGLGGRAATYDLVVAAPPALFGPLEELLAADPPADEPV
jgi:myo-inositol-1(or 4)-monophosphatase